MTDKKPNPSVRIYLGKHHRAWWHALAKFERSKVVNAALDMYRNSGATRTATRTASEPSAPIAQQDAENPERV